MALVHEAQRIEKELAIKNKVKEIKKDFEWILKNLKI
jgi:hypothetical protein